MADLPPHSWRFNACLVQVVMTYFLQHLLIRFDLEELDYLAGSKE